MEFHRRMREYFEPVRINYADKKWAYQKKYIDDLVRQMKISRFMACLSPSEIFKFASSGLCHTDYNAYRHFMDETREYRNHFIGYFNEKKIFSSFRYFTPQPESSFLETIGDLYSLVSGGEVKSQEELNEWMKAHGGTWSVLWKVPYPEGSYGNYPFMDVSDVPLFRFSEQKTAAQLSAAGFSVFALMLAGIILYALTFKAFFKYDVR
jgi:hypothetical protein